MAKAMSSPLSVLAVSKESRPRPQATTCRRGCPQVLRREAAGRSALADAVLALAFGGADRSSQIGADRSWCSSGLAVDENDCVHRWGRSWCHVLDCAGHRVDPPPKSGSRPFTMAPAASCTGTGSPPVGCSVPWPQRHTLNSTVARLNTNGELEVDWSHAPHRSLLVLSAVMGLRARSLSIQAM